MDLKNIEYQDKIGGEISHKDKKQIIAFEIEKEREKMEEKLEEMNNKITYGQYLHQIEEQEDDAKEVLEEAEQIRKEGLEHRIRMEKLEEELRRMVRKKFFDD